MNVRKRQGFDHAVTGRINQDPYHARAHRGGHCDLNVFSSGGIGKNHRLRTSDAGGSPGGGYGDSHYRCISPCRGTGRPGRGQGTRWSINWSLSRGKGGAIRRRIRRGKRGRTSGSGHGGVNRSIRKGGCGRKGR